MPKVDRFQSARKEATKTAKSLASEKKTKQKELETEYDQAPVFVPQTSPAVAKPKAATNGTKSAAVPALKGAVKSKSSFAKVVDDEDENDEDDVEYEVPQASASASSAPSSKKAEKKAKAKTNGHVDEMTMLEEQERAARRQRVVERFLRFLLVGVLLDWWRGRKEASQASPIKSKKAAGKGRKGDRDDNGSLGLREKASSLLEGPFLMLAFTVLLIAANAFGEGFDPDSRGEGHVNFYDTMGLPRGSDIMSIRKAYKALALSWHPDKNPDCRECKSRFAAISEAYETLSDPEKKKAYDQQKKAKGSLESAASVELTAENFERLVLRSSEVWIVQVYNPSDPYCKDFHPIWEDVSLSHQGVARWGRIDQRDAKSVLPQRALVLPVVYRFAHGKEPEFITWGGDRDSGKAPLTRFVAENYPAVRHVAGAELQGWLDGSSQRAKVLLVSKASLPTSGRRAMETMQFWRVANSLSEFFDTATADSAEALKALGVGPAQGDSFALLMSRGGDAPLKRSVADLEDVAGTFQQMAAGVVGSMAPHATLRNHHQLCSAGGLGQATRSFCVVLVDAGETEASAARTAMDQSQVEYAKELLELQAAEGSEDEPQEPMHVQLVRVSTGTSRLPWKPAGVGPFFAQLWREVKYSPAFVLDLETRRVAAVKPKNLGEIFQQIAYEDLRLGELPEELPLSRVWADPERGFRRELLAALSTKIGAAAALLLFATGAAVVPELSLLTSGAAVGSLTALLLASWPSLCRRVLLPLWCATSSGSVQCL